MAIRATLKRFATKLTDVERDAILRDANEKMRQYYVNRPSLDKLKKAKGFFDDPWSGPHLLQFAANYDNSIRIDMSSLFYQNEATPFLGRRIAEDEEFRKRWIPSFYDFTIEKPKNAWTRDQIHELVVELKKDLHERAIRGEFTAEKLEEMRRHFAQADPRNDANTNGWDKLHPGVEDDEEIEEN